MSSDDAFGVAGLKRGFTNGSKLGDMHRNEGMAEHIMREIESVFEFLTSLFKVTDYDRV